MSAVKLKAVHLVDEGAYLVEVPYGVTIEVGGLVPLNRRIVTDNLGELVVVTRKQGEILARTNATGASISPAEYEARRDALLEGATRDEDLEYHFATLDAEFAYRRFMAEWTGVQRAEDVILREKPEVEIVEVRVESGDPDIVSLWNSPNTHHDVRLYELHRDGAMMRVFRDMTAVAGLKVDVPGHSALRFAQIEGVYAFNEKFEPSKLPFVGTLEQCKAEKKACVERVAAIVRTHIAKKEGVRLHNAGDVLLKLQSIRKNLSVVRPRQDSASSLRAAENEVAKLIDGIQQDLA